MSQPTHHQIATFLTDHALSELVRYVMEDTGCSIEQAMEKVYNSPPDGTVAGRGRRVVRAKPRLSV